MRWPRYNLGVNPAMPVDEPFEYIALPDLEKGEQWDAFFLAAALSEALPHDCILTKGPEFAEYGKDTSMDSAAPDVVVLAQQIKHVRHALHVAQHYRVPVYPRGLGSGLSGGAVPVQGGIVLDVSPMAELLAVNPGNRSCRVQPGLTVQKLNEQLAEQNLWFPPWPSSHDIASIGGNIAEDAGGITSVKYGTTKNWLLGLTCVLPGGALLNTGASAVKDVAGFDLTRLICGSEGLLCVVVEAELKLLPLPPHVGTAVYAFEVDEQALAAAEEVIAGPVTPRTFEFMDAQVMQCVILQLGDEAREVLGAAADSAGAVLAIETDAHTAADALEQLEQLIATLTEHGGRRIGLTTDRSEALKLWRVRSELSPACHQRGEFKLAEDVAVPRDRLVEFIRGTREIAAKHSFTWLNYGHLGDGNFHATLMFDDEHDPRIEEGRKAVGELCQLAVKLGGTITGEHGVGIAKSPYLKLQRNEQHIELMRNVKRAFDPHGILNPGKWL